MTNNQLVYIYIIGDRKLKEKFEDLLKNCGGALIGFVYGHGYHESQTLLDYLGFGGKNGKIIVSALLGREQSKGAINRLNEDFSFNKPGTGIAFTVPVEKIVY